MRIALAGDHAGYPLKEQIKQVLSALNVEFEDFGCHGTEAVDYPDYGSKAAAAVNSGAFPRGILFCGSGIGMSIVANRYPKVRAALCHNVFTAASSREHNDANILVLGARIISPQEAEAIVKAWLAGEFQGGRHGKRLDKIAALSEGICEDICKQHD